MEASDYILVARYCCNPEKLRKFDEGRTALRVDSILSQPANPLHEVKAFGGIDNKPYSDADRTLISLLQNGLTSYQVIQLVVRGMIEQKMPFSTTSVERIGRRDRPIVIYGQNVERHIGIPVPKGSLSHNAVSDYKPQISKKVEYNRPSKRKGNSFMVLPIVNTKGDVVAVLNVAGQDFGDSQYLRGQATAEMIGTYLTHKDQSYGRQIAVLDGLSKLYSQSDAEKQLVADISLLVIEVLQENPKNQVKRMIGSYLILPEGVEDNYSAFRDRLFALTESMSTIRTQEGLDAEQRKCIDELVDRIHTWSKGRVEEQQQAEAIKKKFSGEFRARWNKKSLSAHD